MVPPHLAGVVRLRAATGDERNGDDLVGGFDEVADNRDGERTL